MQPDFHHQQLSPSALFRASERRRWTLCRRPITGLLAALIGAVSTLCAAAEPSASGPLAEYVARHDNSYAWRVRREGRLQSVSYAELTLTSQAWKDTTWKHQLFVLRPAEIRDPSRCVLLVDGGSWNDELAGPVRKGDENLPPLWQLLASFSSRLQTPIAVLRQVPRAPIFGALEGRTAISHSFERFINTGDPDWLMLLPMVKSVVRAMDAVQQFGQETWSIDIQRFTVTGASQRGWTTWLTAAIDPRVEGLAPVVFDIVNMGPQMKHQVATFGATSQEIAAYNDRGIAQLSSPIGQRLASIVDPFNYRASLAQPKLIVLATNDGNSPLDALNLYWDSLIGEKYILYLPNNTHEIKDFPRIAGTVGALHRRVRGELTLPQLAWSFDEQPESLRLRFTSDVAPGTVLLWTTSSESRDFRKSVWRSTPVEAVDGAYRLETARPATGFAAMFAEAQFPDKLLPYFLSSNVRIVAAKQAPAK